MCVCAAPTALALAGAEPARAVSQILASSLHRRHLTVGVRAGRVRKAFQMTSAG